MLEKELSNQVIHCFYKVYNTLGYGFLEKVYENALYVELLNNGISCQKAVSYQSLL
jgi:GxxExxY protein